MLANANAGRSVGTGARGCVHFQLRMMNIYLQSDMMEKFINAPVYVPRSKQGKLQPASDATKATPVRAGTLHADTPIPEASNIKSVSSAPDMDHSSLREWLKVRRPNRQVDRRSPAFSSRSAAKSPLYKVSTLIFQTTVEW